MRNNELRSAVYTLCMNHFLYRTTLLVVLLIYAGAIDAHGSLRCKGRIVSVGDQAAKVLALCGEPAQRIGGPR